MLWHRQRLVLLEHAPAIPFCLDKLHAVTPQLGKILQRALGLCLVEHHIVAHVMRDDEATAAGKISFGDLQIRVLGGNADWLAVGYRVHDVRLVPSDQEDALVGHLGPDLLAPDSSQRDTAERQA